MKHRIQKLTGLLTAACLLVIQPFWSAEMSLSAKDMSKITDDLLEGQMVEISTPALLEAPEHVLSAFSSAENADETAYAEDCYASYDGYYALNSDQKKLYNALKKAAHSFYIGTGDADSVSYSDGAMDCFAVLRNSSASLTSDDVAEVVSMFRNDNPIYFFVGSYLLYSTSTFFGTTYISNIYISCMEEYADGTVRQQERTVLEREIASVQEAMPDASTTLEYVTAVHDWIRDTITYAYDENGDPDSSMISHSIVGVFDPDYHAAVCEGYAKAFQLLLNASGVDNYYITGLGNGGGHAWNMARMDDGFFYYFDVTWDDSAQTNAYFAAGETSFSKEHTPFTIDETAWEFLYDLPDVPNASYSGAVGTVYTEGDFTYQLFDTYAALTAYTGTAESVIVPEQVHGLPVTQLKGAFANDANLQEVQLPETITVISYGAQSTGAFENCVSLKVVHMPSKLERVEYDSFYACSALESITIPDTVSRIGARSFTNCNSLGAILIYAPSCDLISQSSIYPDTVIYGYADSTAESYALQYNRMFSVLQEPVTSSSLTTTEILTTTAKAVLTTTITSNTTSISSMTTGGAITTLQSTVTTKSTTAYDSISSKSSTTNAVTTASVISTEPILIADINQDGECALNDLVLMNLYLIDAIQASPSQIQAMDCYHDGLVDIKDSEVMAKFLVRMILVIPIEPEE